MTFPALCRKAGITPEQAAAHVKYAATRVPAGCENRSVFIAAFLLAMLPRLSYTESKQLHSYC